MKHPVRSHAIVAIVFVAGFALCNRGAAQTLPRVALPDGSLDPRFGSGGTAPTVGGAAVVQSDGKIVVVAADGRLARHNVDGSLDRTFGDDGIVATNGGRDIKLQPDGKFLALSGSRTLMRYNSDGSEDDSFGSSGRVTVPWSAYDLALGLDGRIVVAGNELTMRLARYLANGRPDPSFGTGGSVVVDTRAHDESVTAVAVQPDHKILLAGRGFGPTSGSSHDFLVARVRADGTLDPGFGIGGVALTDFGGSDAVTALLHLEDGQIIAGGSIGAGRFNTRYDFGLARYSETGTLNRSVRTIIDNEQTGSGIERLAVQIDGKVVAAGVARDLPSYDRANLAIVQYHSDLTLDNTFGVVGTVITDKLFSVSDLLIQPDGKVLVSGVAGGTSGYSGYLLARYTYDSARGVFGGGARPVPGLVEAEDYDLGGQGIGYADTTPGNEQGTFLYRSDEVDIKLSHEGGHAVGWLASGEWLAYTVDVPRDGTYTIHARVGSALPGRTFHIDVDGVDSTGPLAVPQAAGWDTYQSVSTSLHLPAGRQVLHVVVGPEDWMDFQSFELGEGSAIGPFGGVPHVVPGRVEAEDYDLGGQGRGYFDTTPGNEQGSPVYRPDDVDIKTSPVGYAVGWLAAGEWLAYTVDVLGDGIYTIEAQVGSAFPGRTFHVEIDGVNVTGALAVPQVDEWGRFGVVSAAGVRLGAGIRVVRVVMGSEDFMDFDRLEFVR